MASHKFNVGQSVRFSPDRLQSSTSRGRFKIVRLLPETANVLQYRVKSQTDGHERVVREDQLALFGFGVWLAVALSTARTRAAAGLGGSKVLPFAESTVEAPIEGDMP